MDAKKPNKLILCRGCPGSGKTTLVKKLAKENDGICVAADDFFTFENGIYNFSFSLIQAAHEYCLGTAFYHLLRGKNVYVHNVFAERWTIVKYCDFAHKNHYNWEILEPKTKWRYDAAILAEKNVHGLTAPMIQKMLDRWESTKDILNYAESQNWTV